jgi:hypothetical protein
VVGCRFDELLGGGSGNEINCSAGGQCDCKDDYLFSMVLNDRSGQLDVLVCQDDLVCTVHNHNICHGPLISPIHIPGDSYTNAASSSCRYVWYKA